MQNVDYDDSTFETFFANPPAGLELDALDRARIPRHISCIMDGNGRWATSRGLGRGEGHKAGIVSLREIITACVRLGVEVLSAYAFSTENWKRPKQEVNLLMHLFAQTFVDELPLLKRENVRVVFLGDISALPKRTREVFEYGLKETSTHTGMVLALAVNYGARAELARAARLLAEDLYRRASRSRTHHPHVRRTAPLELPPLAGRLFRVLHHAHVLARLQPMGAARCGPILPGPRPQVRRHP